MSAVSPDPQPDALRDACEPRHDVGSWALSAARMHPDKVAVRAGARQLTFAALAERSLRVANLLTHGLGLREGDRIALLAPNRLEHLELLCGAALGGLVVVALNPRLTAAELGQILGDAGARAMVADERLRPTTESLGGLGFDGRVLLLGSGGVGAESYEQRLAEGSALPRGPHANRSRQPLLQIYTSGTTGRPKGALVSHRNLAAFAAIQEAEGTILSDDVHLAATPFCFLAPAARLLACLHRGATTVIAADFAPTQFLDELARTRATTTLLVPSMVQALLEQDPRGLEGTALRMLMYGGGPMLQAVLEQALERYAVQFHQGYGLTETLTLTSLRPADHRGQAAREVLGSVGREALGVRVAVLRPDGTEAPSGEVGEVVAQSGAIMEGYFRQPEATAEFFRGGWAHTGDLGQFDDRGFLHLTGRLKDMLVCGGINVYPRELELALEAHPWVAEAAVVGKPHPRWGEAPLAFVRLRAGHRDADPAAALEAFLRQRLAGFKVPREYRFVDELPKNASGKVLKHKLRSAT